MNRDKLFLAVTLVCRIGVGIASLLVLARGLGPANYGFMATVLAYSSIASLVTDFGFGIQALRDIGAQPDRAGELIAACIRVKNLLVATATIIAVGALYSLNLSTEALLGQLDAVCVHHDHVLWRSCYHDAARHRAF